MASRPAKGSIIDMKRFQYLLGAFIFLIIGTLLGWSLPHASIPSPLMEEGRVRVTEGVVREVDLMFDEGDGTVRSFENQSFEEGTSLFDFTKKLAETNGMSFAYDPPGQYGILITEMDGKKNGTGGAYWGYWVNNHLGEVSADNYKLKPGDVIEWKFVNLKF